ncbi:MAG: helix-turn-helix transcriptional regulator [Actinomycetia bacterium]|nr:helix-turn-helix transcriptional regulator [Actinomycetes bacterium]
MACSIARAWSVIGEPWTPLILRDLSLGFSRFDDLQADLGIARSILTDRLKTLERAGIVSKQQYPSTNRTRHEYVLTKTGEELVPIIVAVAQWGDRWLDDGTGPPIAFGHSCGVTLQAEMVCSDCGQPVTADSVTVAAGPGRRIGPGTHRADLLPKAPDRASEQGVGSL